MKRIASVLAVTSVILVALPDAGAGRVKNAARAAVEKPTRKLFRFLSKRKNGRVFHERGAAYAASLELAPDNPLGRAPGPVKVTARMSRGSDRPQPTSVPLGAAIRVPDGKGGADDLLMVSSGDGPVRRRLLKSSSSFFGGTTYSSLLPFRVGGQKQLLRLVPEDTAPRPKKRTSGTDLEELGEAADRGAASFILMSEPLRGGGGKKVIGRLVLEQRLPDGEARALKFNPWANRNVRPAGFINNIIRRAAYRGGQEGRSLR